MNPHNSKKDLPPFSVFDIEYTVLQFMILQRTQAKIVKVQVNHGFQLDFVPNL